MGTESKTLRVFEMVPDAGRKAKIWMLFWEIPDLQQIKRTIRTAFGKAQLVYAFLFGQ